MGGIIDQPLELPCGLTLRNRLAKAAMAEALADADCLPNAALEKPYEAWSGGHWGLVITGNVQVDVRHLGNPKDVALNEDVDQEKQLQAWKAWAASCSKNSTATIVQINHPGRQSFLGAGKRGVFEKTLSASPIPLMIGNGRAASLLSRVMFGTPKEMTTADIDDVVRRFAKTARLAADAGFAGAEIHAAHGYLLTQFMSATTNKRTDAYGGSAVARVKIVVDIIRAVRAEVPKGFCIGIKVNSVDHQSKEALRDCIEQLKLIEAAGIDFVEISGGQKSDRTLRREAFFLEFAEAIRSDLPNVLLMVTGGFRTREGIEDALSNGSCDIVGIGRPAALEAALPSKKLLGDGPADGETKLLKQKFEQPWLVNALGMKTIGAGAESKWYADQIPKLK
ncbi:hypothetical protein S40288_05484 [Stachybotrys chartarum IBT 40288]|nr:hypothetical protein S40288_05484 [Stachybotrys chartarum IBT 40288]